MGPSTDGPEALVGREIAGFHLEQVLGVGATGAVFLAQRVSSAVEGSEGSEQTGPEQVAVKILLLPWQMGTEERAEFRSRFMREAQTLQRLQHPHILAVLDVGEQDGFTYMVLPYLSGGTLATKLAAQRGPLPLDEAARYATQLGDALDYAHNLGIIHRDIKPQNVLLDADGTAYLADFSIARLLEETRTKLTSTGRVMGTPAYMAPEQMTSGKVGPASDIYSLGAVLFEMVTGQVPFEADTLIELIRKQTEDPPPRPRQLRSDLPEPAEAVIWQALDKRPEARFPSATALAAAFTEGIHGQWDPIVRPVAMPQPEPHWTTVTTVPPHQWQPPQVVMAPPRRRNGLAAWIAVAALIVMAVLVFNTTNMRTFFSLTSNSGTRPGAQSVDQSANGGSPTSSGTSQGGPPAQAPGNTNNGGGNDNGNNNSGGQQPPVVIAQPTPTPYPTYPGYVPPPTWTPAATWTAVPTWTTAPNSPPPPTWTPVPTWTPAPTWTPYPTPTRYPTPTPYPTPTNTPCPYLNGGNGVTFYSGTNYGGQSWNWYVAAGNVNAVANLPSGIAGNLGSFIDSNSAWHVVLYQGPNGTGNLGHYDNSSPDVGSYWRATQSVKIYINRSC